MKMVRLSGLRTGRLYPPVNIPGIHFCYRLSGPKIHSAAGRNMSIKNSNDTIGNRTRDLPVLSAVPQPNAPPHSNLQFSILLMWIIGIFLSFKYEINLYYIKRPSPYLAVNTLPLSYRNQSVNVV